MNETFLKKVDKYTTCCGAPYFAKVVIGLRLRKVESNPRLYINAQDKEQRNLALRLLETK